MRIVFDLDGVLADFVLGFTTLANQLYGTPVYSTSQQKEWQRFDGLNPEQVDKVWKTIDTLPTFWTDLQPLIDKPTCMQIHLLTHDHDVYFVTSRSPAGNAKRQAEEWLRRHICLYTSPTVVMTKEKGEFCKIAKIDALLEDRPKSALWVLYQSPKTRVFLLDQPYNRLGPEAWAAVDEKSRIRRVQTVEQFLNLLSYLEKGMKI